MWRAPRQDKKPKMTPANNYGDETGYLLFITGVGTHSAQSHVRACLDKPDGLVRRNLSDFSTSKLNESGNKVLKKAEDKFLKNGSV